MNFHEERYRFLSNFYPHPIQYQGLTYPTVENAFQAAKAASDKRLPFTTCRPEMAKKIGKTVPINKTEWDAKRISVMRELLQIKFSDNELAEKLKAVEEPIIEDNNWNDYFWGVCNGRGQNQLGKLLSEIRENILSKDNEYDFSFFK